MTQFKSFGSEFFGRLESCKIWLSPKDNGNTCDLTREDPKSPLTRSVGHCLEILPPSFGEIHRSSLLRPRLFPYYIQGKFENLFISTHSSSARFKNIPTKPS